MTSLNKLLLCALCVAMSSLMSACDDETSPALVVPDTGAPAGVEAGVEAGAPAGVEVGVEAGAPAGVEAGAPAGVEAGAPAGVEAGAPAGVEAGVETPLDPWLEEAERLAREGQLALTREAQPTGDPEEGLRYLLYGDYVAGGIPVEVYERFVGFDERNVLNREGPSAQLPPSFNLFEMPNGVEVVGGVTCLGCHSSYLNGELVIGLGNAFSQFAEQPPSFLSGLLETYVRNTYGAESPEWLAFQDFSRGSARVAPYAKAPFRGVNPAFLIEAGAITQRDPVTFAWLDEPQAEPPLPPRGLSSDVPPWWHLKKKAALYYNGMGRGRFTKMLMQISVVAIQSREQAEDIHNRFPDLLAWLQTLEPPVYPEPIDEVLATQGKEVFEQTCARCHGTYRASFEPEGVEETYPNLLISLTQVGTDPQYALQSSADPWLSRWLNRGWYGEPLSDARSLEQGLPPAQMQAYPLEGYVAPPLDGVWATAPYLHNGSVPTLAALLNSATRPTRWMRNFNSSTYDMSAVGWPHEVIEEGQQVEDPLSVYDTTLEGYSAQGHTFADHLSDEERQALLAYLKAL